MFLEQTPGSCVNLCTPPQMLRWHVHVYNCKIHSSRSHSICCNALSNELYEQQQVSNVCKEVKDFFTKVTQMTHTVCRCRVETSYLYIFSSLIFVFHKSIILVTLYVSMWVLYIKAFAYMQKHSINFDHVVLDYFKTTGLF